MDLPMFEKAITDLIHQYERERLADSKADLHEMTMKFLTLKSFITRHFQEDEGICVHTWCPYHKEGSVDFCCAHANEDRVRENCYRTWHKE
jgi:hypothetical protein